MPHYQTSHLLPGCQPDNPGTITRREVLQAHKDNYYKSNITGTVNICEYFFPSYAREDLKISKQNGMYGRNNNKNSHSIKERPTVCNNDPCKRP